MGERSSSFTTAPSIFRPSALAYTGCVILQVRLWRFGRRTRRPAATDLVALVDAVDELRVRGRPRETDRRRVDRLGLHVAGGDGGHWGWTRRGKMDEGRKGRVRKKGEVGKTKKQRCESSFQSTAGSLPASILMSVLIAAAQVRADAAIALFLMTLTPNTRALCGFV